MGVGEKSSGWAQVAQGNEVAGLVVCVGQGTQPKPLSRDCCIHEVVSATSTRAVLGARVGMVYWCCLGESHLFALKMCLFL